MSDTPYLDLYMERGALRQASFTLVSALAQDSQAGIEEGSRQVARALASIEELSGQVKEKFKTAFAGDPLIVSAQSLLAAMEAKATESVDVQAALLLDSLQGGVAAENLTGEIESLPEVEN